MGQGRQSGDVTRECTVLLSLFLWAGTLTWFHKCSKGTGAPARLKTGKEN